MSPEIKLWRRRPKTLEQFETRLEKEDYHAVDIQLFAEIDTIRTGSKYKCRTIIVAGSEKFQFPERIVVRGDDHLLNEFRVAVAQRDTMVEAIGAGNQLMADGFELTIHGKPYVDSGRALEAQNETIAKLEEELLLEMVRRVRK